MSSHSLKPILVITRKFVLDFPKFDIRVVPIAVIAAARLAGSLAIVTSTVHLASFVRTKCAAPLLILAMAMSYAEPMVVLPIAMLTSVKPAAALNNAPVSPTALRQMSAINRVNVFIHKDPLQVTFILEIDTRTRNTVGKNPQF